MELAVAYGDDLHADLLVAVVGLHHAGVLALKGEIRIGLRSVCCAVLIGGQQCERGEERKQRDRKTQERAMMLLREVRAKSHWPPL